MVADPAQVIKTAVSEVTVEVPWGQISGKVWGSLTASPILCVHGTQDNANTFDKLIPLLPSSFCYVAIDLPGCGRSSHFPPGFIFSITEYCMSLNRVVNHFGWKKFIYMGHSLGGQIGYLYAAFYPQEVSKLVILDAVMPHRRKGSHLADIIPNSYSKLQALEMKLRSQSPPCYSEDEAVNRLTEGRPFPLTREAAKALFSRGVVKNGDGFSFSYDQRLKLRVPFHYSKEEVLSVMRRIQCPLFNLRASDTQKYIGHLTRDFEKLLKTSLRSKYHYCLIEGSHDVHLLHPEKFAQKLSLFLTKVQSTL
ncbi:putative serine hydrolase [Frankliniella fusca]|uniref:Serine hydrolase n=1 Tax=Frankliniella fusca TaxID=407009 RepID=A0AAE1LKQ4_9NEOP|nr:putative serine hydrolase [Frankliniella fusca]